MKPTRRPGNPCFSSGPCAKRPGWSPEVLNQALLGRSHRSRPGLARLVEVIERSRAILQMPADYRLGIVPASDTGAVEMALWSLLGARGVDLLSWESFGEGWVSDVTKQLKLKDVRLLDAPYGSLPDLGRGRSGPRRGVRVERHDFRGARPERRLDRIGPQGADDLRCDLGRLRDAAAVGQARCRHLVVAEGTWAARRGTACWRCPRAPSSGWKATRRPGRLPKIFRLTSGGKLIEGIFRGETINTPSMLCVEDAIELVEMGRGGRRPRRACRARRGQPRGRRGVGRALAVAAFFGEGPGDPVLHIDPARNHRSVVSVRCRRTTASRPCGR